MFRYREIKQGTADVLGVRVVRRANIEKAHAAIRDVILNNDALSYRAIAEMLGCSRWLVYSVAVEFGIRRPRGAGSPAWRKTQKRPGPAGTFPIGSRVVAEDI